MENSLLVIFDEILCTIYAFGQILKQFDTFSKSSAVILRSFSLSGEGREAFNVSSSFSSTTAASRAACASASVVCMTTPGGQTININNFI